MTSTSTADALTPAGPLGPDELTAIDAWWRAANYLSVGQIYLLDDPLLEEPLRPEHIKPRLLGHWGTTPGLTFMYAHANRTIRQRGFPALFVTGPGHGGPAIAASTWLEGTYSDTYPDVPRDHAGMLELFRRFSFPGGTGSHVTPRCRGRSTREASWGTRWRMRTAPRSTTRSSWCSASWATARRDRTLAAGWQSLRFVDPVSDGAVIPILHLNGYKIANPTVLARISGDELESLFRGYGYQPLLVEGEDPPLMHQRMAQVMDEALDAIADIQRRARSGERVTRPAWPMIILRSPKGWTGPKEVDGLPTEGSFRSHQVPLAEVRQNASHLAQLEAWLRSYRPEELFDPDGRPIELITSQAPRGDLRMGANPRANGGLLLHDLKLPDFRDYAVTVERPGATMSEATKVAAQWLQDVIRANPRNFRIVGPDETASNRLSPVFEATDRQWGLPIVETDDHLAPHGRVLEILSEHTCQGWLEGYLLTGRHGLFDCYEAFIHIIDSMFNQHAKWLKMTREIHWRRPIASLNYLLTSHVWRQDHNGFSHQDPGFIDHVVNKKSVVIRVYLPPDANTLLSTMDHCLRSRHYVKRHRGGKQPALSYLSMDEAVLHCARGIGLWEWASNDAGAPGRGLACAGGHPDARDARGGGHPAARAARPASAGGQRRGPHAAPARHGASPRDARPRVRLRCSPWMRRSSSPTTATRGSSIDWPTDAPTTTTCTFAATRRRAPSPRPSTWSCSTTSTAITW